jgi:hypothetical protein
MAVWPKKFSRPGLIVFSDNNLLGVNDYNSSTNMILSDHGRSALDVKPERIETSGRMVNGTYRSHFVAEKKEFSWSWEDLPTRTFTENYNMADEYASATDVITYLEERKKPFYLKLFYDDAITGFYPMTTQPSFVYKVMIKDYSYKIKMRTPKFDIMDIDVTLVEV